MLKTSWDEVDNLKWNFHFFTTDERQMQILENVCKRGSDNCSPESGIYNTHSENYSSDDICKTESSRYSSSHSPLEDTSTSPDLYSVTSSNTSSSLTASADQCSQRNLNDGSRYWFRFSLGKIIPLCHLNVYERYNCPKNWK